MIGATTSQTLDLTLINKGDTIYGTSTIKLEIGLKTGSTIEYIPVGIYNIDDVEKNDYTVKITAYDNMIKFETVFATNLGDTLTLQQVVSELARITGVQFTGSLPSYNVKKLEGFSCRDVLGYVASICGGNAVITRDGKFTIVTPKDVNYYIGTDNYFDYNREEVKYKIGKISCQVEEVLSKGSLGTDSMELQFENPWVNETILTDIYNKLNGFEYLGYSMKWQGDLSLDVGDIITVTDKKGVVRKHPILSQKFTYTGGLTSEIGAKGETKNKNNFSSSGSTAKKVDRVVAELLIVNEALIEKANIQQLEAVVIRTQTLEAKTATIEEAIIKKANIEDLNAINATIENLKVVDLVAINTKIVNLQADKANITDLTATNIKFNVASGGTLDLQTLLSKHITGENGQFINISSSNTVIANAVIKDAMIENISVNKLLAGTISTNKFNISSDDGGIQIVGPTMQFKDKNNKVRVQIGQDAKGDFNFGVFDSTGTGVLIDATGVKEKALADGIIKDRMINEGEIGGNKIDINSLITEVNKDSNTTAIKGSKVLLDTEGQKLDVAFNSLKSNINNKESRNLLIGTSNELIEAKVGQWEGDFKHTNGTIDTRLYGLKKGDKVTLSVYMEVPSNASSDMQLRLSCYNDNNIMVVSSGGTIVKKGDSGYSVFTITIGDYPKILPRLRKVDTTQTSIDNIKIKYQKLEIGENSNPIWTEAPEDVASKIEANTTSINIAQGKIEGLISENSIIKGDITTITDKYISLKATVDGINTTVASHTSSITNIKNTADSALFNANSANSKIDNLQVGARNLLTGTSKELKSVTLSGWGDWVMTGTNGTWMSIEANKTYTARIYLKSSTQEVRILCRGYRDGDGSKYYDYWGNNIAAGKEGYSIVTFTTQSDVTHLSVFAIRFNSYNTPSNIVQYKELKLEKGNKPTDYTQAPEDVDSAINEVNTKVTTVENKYTSLEQNLNGFKTTVSNTYSTKTEVSNLSGTVSSLTSKVSTAESNITQLNNKIALKVEASDITEAINKIQIGGRNLWIKSKTTGYSSIEELGDNHITGQKECYRINNGATLNFNIEPNFSSRLYRKVTFSAWVKYENVVQGTNSWNRFNCFKHSMKRKNSNTGVTTSEDYMSLQGFVGTSDWKKIEFTYDYSANKSYDQLKTTLRFNVEGAKSGTAWVTGIKVELGDKVTDYSESPEDIESSISTVDNKVAIIETNLNSITQRVSSTEQTTTTINGAVTNLTSRVNSAENKLTATSLTTTISESITNGTTSITTTQFIMDKNGLTIKNGSLSIWNKSNTQEMIYLGSDGNVVFGGNIRMELASNRSKYIEIKAVPYSTDIGCKLVLGGSTLDNSFSIENPSSIKYFWVNREGTYISNNLCITSDQKDTSPTATDVIFDDGAIYPAYNNKGLIGTDARRWKEINGTTARIYDLTVENSLSTKAINTNNSNINAGTGSITCGSGTVNGAFSVTNGLKVRGTLDTSDIDCTSIVTNGNSINAGNGIVTCGGVSCSGNVAINGYYAIVGNGSTTSKQVKGLSVLSGTSTYMEIQMRNGSLYGVNVWASDIKIKENIELIETSKVKVLDNNKIGLEAVLAIDHYGFDYKDKNLNHVSCGYIAQQLIEVNKNFAYNVKQKDGTDMYCPDVSALIPTLSLAIKQQQVYIKALEERIKLLESA